MRACVRVCVHIHIPESFFVCAKSRLIEERKQRIKVQHTDSRLRHYSWTQVRDSMNREGVRVGEETL